MSLDTFTPSTELDAVNAILAAGNHAPVNTLNASRPDVVLAQAALSAALRETMTSRWRFNTDINYRLAGTTFSGAYVYPEPANLLSFTVTPTEAQRGLDIVSRASRTYQVSSQSVRILANRIGGVDTLTQAELFINPIWSVPFSLAPEAARRYITASAIRRRAVQSGFPKEQIDVAAADEQAALSELAATESPVPPAASAEGWATETDALNTILAMASQPGVADVLESEGQSLRALNSLRQAVVDVCSMGWRFNSENGYGIEPLNVSYDWLDVDGTTTPILIYAKPDRLLTLVASTMTPEQQGSKTIDPIVATAVRYRDVGGAAPAVIYDRTNHRDGFPSADRTVLWLDVTWRKPFAEMPEEARRCATIMAGRRFCASLGSTPRWTPQDEQAALIALQRAEGKRDRRNILTDNASVRSVRGRTRGFDLRYV